MAAPRSRVDDGATDTTREGDTMTRSILCGVDGSTDSRLALRTAVRLADELDAGLVVAHVVQTAIGTSPRLGIVAGATMVSPLDELESGRKLLDAVLEQEELADADRRVVYGFPADRLADLADEVEAELIVVGSRGRGAFKAAFLGSVSSELIGVARCPVLVVPPGAALGGAGRNDHIGAR
jgi:nucleotide-binding universal stress UspA family protein